MLFQSVPFESSLPYEKFLTNLAGKVLRPLLIIVSLLQVTLQNLLAAENVLA